MSRPHRPCSPGTIYHVTARGDNREPIFHDDSDYQRYLQILKEYKTRWTFALFSYALMPNHVHLLLRTENLEGTISKILHDIQLKYSKYFNFRYQRIGHVFQGRFHTSIVEKEAYLLMASRYIHLNPVRAKLCNSASTYPWTSFGAYMEPPCDPLHLVDSDLILSMIETRPSLQRAVYKQLVQTEWYQVPER